MFGGVSKAAQNGLRSIPTGLRPDIPNPLGLVTGLSSSTRPHMPTRGARQDPGEDHDTLWTMAAASPPPKTQRLSRSRDPSASRCQLAPTPTYAQKASTPAHLAATPTMVNSPQHPQALTWSETWNPSMAGQYLTSDAGSFSPRSPTPGPSSPHQQPALIQAPSLPPYWHAYLQAMPTKEDFDS